MHFSCLRQVCLRRDLLLISFRYGLNGLDSGRVLNDGGLHEVGVGIHRVARDVLATCVSARWRETVRVHVDVFIVLSVPPLTRDDDTKNLPHSGYRAGASDLWWRFLTRSFRCTKSPRCPSRRSCHRPLRSIGRAGTVCLSPSRACRREAGFSTFRVPQVHLSWI